MVSTLFLDTDAQVEAWLARRRQLGLDGRDEVWEGVYHVVPHEHGRNGVVAMALSDLVNGPARAAGLTPGGSFNLGGPEDFRVPDLGFHRGGAPALYYSSAALVVEVLSPRDETFAKVGFYAAHGVEELWVVDPLERTVRIWQLGGGAYAETGRSGLLALAAEDVAADLHWPEG